MLVRFEQRLEEIAGNSDIRAVGRRGAGRAFCAGADMGGGGGAQRTKSENRDNNDRTARRQLRQLELPQPVIAAVHGYALGRGMETALWCDMVIAEKDAKL